MNKKEFFESLSSWKTKNMTLDFLQATELKEMLHKNIELLSEKDVRNMLEQLMYEIVTGTHYVQVMDSFVRKFPIENEEQQ